MPKAFLIRKKLSAKDLFNQAYLQDSCIYQPDTPPPSPEEELNQNNRVHRRVLPAQSQLAQLSSNGHLNEPIAGPSGLLNTHSTSGKLIVFFNLFFFR